MIQKIEKQLNYPPGALAGKSRDDGLPVYRAIVYIALKELWGDHWGNFIIRLMQKDRSMRYHYDKVHDSMMRYEDYQEKYLHVKDIVRRVR